MIAFVFYYVPVMDSEKSMDRKDENEIVYLMC